MNACHSGAADRQTLAIAHLQGESYFFVHAGERFYSLELIIHIAPLVAKAMCEMVANYTGAIRVVDKVSEPRAVFRHQFPQIAGSAVHRAGYYGYFVFISVWSWQIYIFHKDIVIAKIILMVSAGARSRRSGSDAIRYCYV